MVFLVPIPPYAADVSKVELKMHSEQKEGKETLKAVPPSAFANRALISNVEDGDKNSNGQYDGKGKEKVAKETNQSLFPEEFGFFLISFASGDSFSFLYRSPLSYFFILVSVA
jgi:hypothetical protein